MPKGTWTAAYIVSARKHPHPSISSSLLIVVVRRFLARLEADSANVREDGAFKPLFRSS